MRTTSLKFIKRDPAEKTLVATALYQQQAAAAARQA